MSSRQQLIAAFIGGVILTRMFSGSPTPMQMPDTVLGEQTSTKVQEAHPITYPTDTPIPATPTYIPTPILHTLPATTSISIQHTAPFTAPAEKTEYTCSGKTRCAQMNSCAEARFYLTQCGATRLDGDHDGTPCESICGQ